MRWLLVSALLFVPIFIQNLIYVHFMIDVVVHHSWHILLTVEKSESALWTFYDALFEGYIHALARTQIKIYAFVYRTLMARFLLTLKDLTCAIFHNGTQSHAIHIICQVNI